MKFKLSKETILWALFIIVSASFFRQVLNFLLAVTGRRGVEFLLWAVFLVAVLFMVRSFAGPRLSYWRILLLTLITAGAFYYAWRMKIVEERLHIVKYGLLGWLTSKDTAELNNAFLGGLTALLLCVLVASADELFQYWLPFRVGDVRDVGFAVIGASIGISLFWSSKV